MNLSGSALGYFNNGFCKESVIETMSLYVYLSIVDIYESISNGKECKETLKNTINSIIARDIYSNEDLHLNLNKIMEMLKNSYPNLYGEENFYNHKDKMYEVAFSIKRISEIVTKDKESEIDFTSKHISEIIAREDGLGRLMKENMSRFWYSLYHHTNEDVKNLMKEHI